MTSACHHALGVDAKFTRELLNDNAMPRNNGHLAMVTWNGHLQLAMVSSSRGQGEAERRTEAEKCWGLTLEW